MCSPGRSGLMVQAQDTETPSLTSEAACFLFSSVTKFTVPSWSSGPQRPQLEQVSA